MSACDRLHRGAALRGVLCASNAVQTERIASGSLPKLALSRKERAVLYLHRHLAVPHRRSGGQAFRRVDDGIGVDAIVAVKVADAAGLPKVLDAERLDPVAAHAAEPAERGRMAVDHGDD